MTKNSDGKKWTREKLSSGISNDDFFATLSFCQSLGCGRRPRWVSIELTIRHKVLLLFVAVACTPAKSFADQTSTTVDVAAPAHGSSHFEAVWPDGTTREAPDVEGWTGDGRAAKIAGRPLFVSPLVQTLRNTSIPHRQIEGPFIEFVQGDMLPAQVTGTVAGDSSLDDTILQARPHERLDLAGAPGRDLVQVRAAWVRRLVWTRSSRRVYQPGTAFRRDQSSLVFQKIRFELGGVHLLTDDKVAIVDWGDLAELHLPTVDWWRMHAREQAVLCPEMQASLVRLSTGTGMRLTASLDRFHAWTIGQQATCKDTFHFLQPAWSVDVLCVGRDQVRQYVVLPPLEVPLSAIEPASSVHHAVFSRLLSHWTRDGSVLDEPLVSGGRQFAWGIGAFGGHELEFAMHPAAARLRTGIGLDRAAGAGGCLRGRIELLTGDRQVGERQVGDRKAATAMLLHESEIVIGAARAIVPISVELAAANEGARIRLAADAVLDNAPADADPYDIGDYCDWLEPRVELRKDLWTADVTAAIPASHPALRGWTFDGKVGRDWRPVTLWDDTTRPYPSFHRAWVLPGFPLALSRKIAVPKSGPAKLNVHVRRSAITDRACRLDVSVNDVSVANLPLPEPTPQEPTKPIVIDLEPFAGREVRVELRLVPLAGETRVIWEGARFESIVSP
jgi:hypothetical protein